MSQLSTSRAVDDARFVFRGSVTATNALEAKQKIRRACDNLGMDDIHSVTVTISDWVRSHGDAGPGMPIQWDFDVEGHATINEVTSDSDGADSLRTRT